MNARADPWPSVQEFLSCLELVDVEFDSDGRNPVVTLDEYATFGRKPTPNEWRALWLRRVEALELLAIVWHVDLHKWTWLVADIAQDIIRGDKIRDAGMPAYKIRWPWDERSELMCSFFDLVFTPVRDEERSPEFREAKAGLQALEIWPRVQAAREDLQISMVLECLGDTDQHDAFMRSYEKTEGGPLRFKLAGVGYSRITSRDDPITLDDATNLHNQVERCIPISSATFKLPCVDSNYTRHVINQLLTDLLGEYGPKWLYLHRMYGSRGAVEAFFSKLTEKANKCTTTATKTLAMNKYFYGESRAERRMALLWFVYGLFGPDARHTIQHLDMTGVHSLNPREKHIRWLSELLRTQGAPRPELFIADAFEEYSTREAPACDLWLVVPSGYPIHVELDGDSPGSLLRFEDRVTKFRILRNEMTRPFVDILVPGYGHCWVKRSETLATETAPVTPWTLDQHSIRSMAIKVYRMDAEEKSWMCALLELVGGRMESLQLVRQLPHADWEVSPGFLGIEQLSTFVRSCPRLHTLTLDNIAILVRDLVELYEVHQCKITTLNLSDMHFRTGASVVELLNKLADASLQISRSIKDLSLDIAHYDLAKHEAEVMAALFSMLKANRVLVSVHLHVPTSQLAKYEAEFRDVRETAVPVGSLPLPKQTTCALLSVIHHKALDLELGVLTTIFEFAAEIEMRQVTITETLSTEQYWWDQGERD